MKRLVILGSTGSIGTQTLEIVENYPDRYKAVALSANNNWKLLAEQVRKFGAKKAAIANPAFEEPLREALSDLGVEVLSGSDGIKETARVEADMAVVALVGISGLAPTLAAIETGKEIALANKETLVVGGEIVTRKAAEKGIPIIPIDSEHSAVFQCLGIENPKTVKKIILTSSGGPFRTLPSEEIFDKKAADALKHPNWVMGHKVTIDSSTMMNKGFEVIEAKWLFDVEADDIEVVVHPQSVIHSMVEYIDGSIIAQLSLPDMRIPIQYALTWPDRLPADFVKTDFYKIKSLTFEEPRLDAFPCLSYAFDAVKKGGTMPAVLNGANEVAVDLFLKDVFTWGRIAETIKQVMEEHEITENPTLEDLFKADAWARQRAFEINGMNKQG